MAVSKPASIKDLPSIIEPGQNFDRRHCSPEIGKTKFWTILCETHIHEKDLDAVFISF